MNRSLESIARTSSMLGVLALTTPLAVAQNAPSQDAAKELQELRQRMEQLETQLAAQKQAVPASAPAPQSAPVAAAKEEPSPAWKDLISAGNRFKVYGFARLDIQRDDSRPNNTQTIGWILSEDPTAPAAGPVGAGGSNKSDLTMHPRLSRLGFDFDGGSVESLGNAKVTGKIEVDFFNNGLAGQSESRSALRMRHAWLRMAWDRVSLLAGQSNDIISPLFPIVNSDLVMWGAGNLGDRRPQLRFEYAPPASETGFIAQAEIGLSGADDNADLDTAGTYGAGFRDGETSDKPTLQARVANRFELGKGKAEVGVWAHRAWEHPDTSFAGENRFDSEAYGLDVNLPVYEDIVGFKAEWWTGKNVDDVRGGIFQGINRTTGDEIAAKGGFAELSYKVSDHLTSYVGFSNDNPDNADVGAQGRAENVIKYAALRWNYKPLSFGLEYLDWTTKYVGLTDGDDNRVAGFLQYSF
ncbi:MAG: hypothetical protein IPJ77_06570 [Planctomycetes bacterium]|nr:hypothetical protein [Planctomycetota bacterium]